MMMAAAKKRGKALSHILLSEPPRLGKTPLGMTLGQEMGSDICVTSGPIIRNAGDLADLLMSLETSDLSFINKMYRMPKTVEEYLFLQWKISGST
jgi:Holliday junction DNA helicase RuvB